MIFTVHIMPTSTGEKFTQFPTTDPFVFIYEDHNYYSPQRDVDKMEEWEIQSDKTFQNRRQDCTLKKFISKLPPGMQVVENDCNLLNTEDWSTHNLKTPIQVKRNINMPWISIAGNLYYESGPGDIAPVQYKFPYISTAQNDAWYNTTLEDQDTKEQFESCREELTT